jgi:glutamate dehydrogenase
VADARYRPEAVNISNVAALADTEGKPHFKYIVEGANLFLTQQARLYLEKRKVVLFKDSSANKGKLSNQNAPKFSVLTCSMKVASQAPRLKFSRASHSQQTNMST